jgi:hypothetical protein
MSDTCICGHKFLAHSSLGSCVLCAGCQKFTLGGSLSPEEISHLEREEVPRRLVEDVFQKCQLAFDEREKVNQLRAAIEVRWLSDDEIKWITDVIRYHKGPPYLFGLVARFWEHCYDLTRDQWYLTRAGSSWRDAGCPQFAVSCLDGHDSVTDLQLAEAIRSCRAGALADLGDLDGAESEAEDAIILYDKKPHPYNVLGRISYKRGEYELGDSFFQQAEERGDGGPSRRDIQELLDSMNPQEKQAFARHLLKANPKKHAWLEKYA